MITFVAAVTVTISHFALKDFILVHNYCCYCYSYNSNTKY
jgi:hypothetical protein